MVSALHRFFRLTLTLRFSLLPGLSSQFLFHLFAHSRPFSTTSSVCAVELYVHFQPHSHPCTTLCGLSLGPRAHRTEKRLASVKEVLMSGQAKVEQAAAGLVRAADICIARHRMSPKARVYTLSHTPRTSPKTRAYTLSHAPRMSPKTRGFAHSHTLPLPSAPGARDARAVAGGG
jgi:hypothetical protein